jgi:hypothetical protein
MYSETKMAVKKAFEIGKIVFSLGGERYLELLKAVSSVRPPTREELSEHLINGIPLEDALIIEIKERYKRAAMKAGFTERQGVAMLEYAALLKELKDE